MVLTYVQMEVLPEGTTPIILSEPNIQAIVEVNQANIDTPGRCEGLPESYPSVVLLFSDSFSAVLILVHTHTRRV